MPPSKTITLDKGDGDYIIKAWSYGNKGEGNYELNISSGAIADNNNGTVSTSAVIVTKGEGRPEPLSQAERIYAVVPVTKSVC